MSMLVRRRLGETVVRVSLAPPEPPPPPEAFARQCVSYVGQLSPSEENAQEVPRGRWLAENAKNAYSAAGHKLSESVRPPCRKRV